MSKRGIVEILSDIKEAISRINNYIGNLNYEEFLKDLKTQDAIVRNFEIIGEAVKTLPDDLKIKTELIQHKKDGTLLNILSSTRIFKDKTDKNRYHYLTRKI